MLPAAPSTPTQRVAMTLCRLGADPWLSRLAIGVPIYHGGTHAPLLPVADRDRVRFCDTLEMHLLADMQEASLAECIAANRRN